MVTGCFLSTLKTSRIWGELTAAAQRVGRTVRAGDGLVAATARRHGLHVMTNVADFEPTGVLLLNPWTVVAEPQRSKKGNNSPLPQRKKNITTDVSNTRRKLLRLRFFLLLFPQPIQIVARLLSKSVRPFVQTLSLW